jgi:hypothetical protein
MRLTFEMTRGTRTIHWPLDKSSDYPPELTIMIRPALEGEFDESDEFEAAVAFCNPCDEYVKRRGRAIAFERLNSVHKIVGSAQEIREAINEKVRAINLRRDPHGGANTFPDYYVPDMDEGQVQEDLAFILSFEALSKYFTRKDENRDHMERHQVA